MITIYGAEWCSYCLKAKIIAQEYQLDFEFKDVDNINVAQQLKALLHDYKTIPQIWWHGNHIGGYEDFVRELENTRSFGQDNF